MACRKRSASTEMSSPTTKVKRTLEPSKHLKCSSTSQGYNAEESTTYSAPEEETPVCILCCDPALEAFLGCPNVKCDNFWCSICHDKLLERDYRCPCCRTQLPEAKVTRPMWEAGDDMAPVESVDEAAEHFYGLPMQSITPSQLLGLTPDEHLTLETVPGAALLDTLYLSTLTEDELEEEIEARNFQTWANHFPQRIPGDWIILQRRELATESWRLTESNEAYIEFVVNEMTARWEAEQAAVAMEAETEAPFRNRRRMVAGSGPYHGNRRG